MRRVACQVFVFSPVSHVPLDFCFSSPLLVLVSSALLAGIFRRRKQLRPALCGKSVVQVLFRDTIFVSTAPLHFRQVEYFSPPIPESLFSRGCYCSIGPSFGINTKMSNPEKEFELPLR